MGFKFEVSGDSSGFHCSDSNLNAEPALTSQLWSRNCFPLLSFSWRIYNIRGLSITMRLHLSSPWRTEEKQTGFSNTLFPLEELNQTSLPTLFCPWKATCKSHSRARNIHSQCFPCFSAQLNRFTLHGLGSSSTLFVTKFISSVSVYLLQTNKEINPQKISGNSSTGTFLLSQQVLFLAPSVSWKSVL